jgi:hypothetical protein
MIYHFTLLSSISKAIKMKIQIMNTNPFLPNSRWTRTKQPVIFRHNTDALDLMYSSFLMLEPNYKSKEPPLPTTTSLPSGMQPTVYHYSNTSSSVMIGLPLLSIPSTEELRKWPSAVKFINAFT